MFQMAYDAFLKIDVIPGESTDAKHKEWVELMSWSFGVSQPISGERSMGGHGSASRASFQDFTIVKNVDKATNKLIEACSKGEHIKEITLELCRATGDKTKYLEYKLGDVIVTSDSVGGGGGESLPSETVSFNYGTIKSTYTVLDSTSGKSKGNVSFGFSVVENKAI